MDRVLIEFDRQVAPALDMSDPFQMALRATIMDPRRYPVVHFIGRSFGKVQESPTDAITGLAACVERARKKAFSEVVTLLESGISQEELIKQLKQMQ